MRAGLLSDGHEEENVMRKYRVAFCNASGRVSAPLPVLGSWFVKNVQSLKTFVRVVFGVVWLIDGSLKFSPGTADSLPDLIRAAGQGQPAWLVPWFDFWSNTVGSAPTFYAYSVGVLEILLGSALVLGFLRKVAYVAGAFLSLFIWSVPEGFGGPYGPGSTDIGTGIIYSIVFLLLMVVNATYGPSKYSLDYVLERRLRIWKKLAEFRG